MAYPTGIEPAVFGVGVQCVILYATGTLKCIFLYTYGVWFFADIETVNGFKCVFEKPKKQGF